MYGCCGAPKTSATPPLLDDFAGAHHAHPLRDLADDGEVVGDEQQRHVHARLQILQQLQDLGLDGDVEGRRRLVGDEQVRLVGQRHGDHHPLLLAARELMRVGVEPAAGLAQAHQLDELENAPARLPAAQAAVDQQRLGDLLPDRVQRVERGERLLEIIVIRSPRRARLRAGGALGDSSPLKRTRPCGCRPAAPAKAA